MDTLSPNLSPDNANRFFLGKLCKRNHDYNGTGMSLRYHVQSKCVECTRERSKSRFTTDEYREKERSRRASPERVEYLHSYQSSPEYKQYLQEWGKRRRSTEHGKSLKRIYNARRRSLKQSKSIPYTLEQIKERRYLFSNACAYCGEQGETILDHFIPIKVGGWDALFNLVPACPPCNFSKNGNEAFEWYFKRPYASVERWDYILSVVGA